MPSTRRLFSRNATVADRNTASNSQRTAYGFSRVPGRGWFSAGVERRIG
jgi:hypothetical protein